MGDWPPETPSALRSHQAAAAFKAAWAHCNDAVRRSVAKTWLDQSLGPLRAHIAAIVPEVQQEHERREAFVKDFDSYRRRYHALQDKHAKAAAADPASAKAAELERALYGIQSKLTASEDRYRRQNAKVKEAMLGAKLARDELLETAVLTALTLQMELFRQGAERLADLAQFLPEERAQPLRDAVRALVAKGGPEVRTPRVGGVEKMFKTVTGALGTSPREQEQQGPVPAATGTPQQQQQPQQHAFLPSTSSATMPPTPSGVNTSASGGPPAKSPTKPVSSGGLGSTGSGRSTFSSFFTRSASKEEGKGAAAAGYGRLGSEGGAAGPGGETTAMVVGGGGAGGQPPLFYARALYDNEPEDESELGFAVGDVLEIMAQDESGWWEARLNGRVGSIPANYVEAVPRP